jgi:hypothetical protein
MSQSSSPSNFALTLIVGPFSQQHHQTQLYVGSLLEHGIRVLIYVGKVDFVRFQFLLFPLFAS